jgi:3-hydroxyacyl-CoA dehydrogenase
VARATAEAHGAARLELARRIGKEPVLVNDSPGFATSRLGVLLGLEAMRMVEEGVASPPTSTPPWNSATATRWGPLRLTDLVGLDVRLDIARYLHEKLGAECFRPPRILEEWCSTAPRQEERPRLLRLERGADMTFETLLLSIEDRVAVITINRPDKRNALNASGARELVRRWTPARGERGARCHLHRRG